jgi:hypothetical protein
VTYKGKALTEGTINFINPDKGHASIGDLDSSGAYTLQGTLPAGTYKVYFNPPVPQQLEPGKMPKAKAPYPLPSKLQDPKQTPVTKEVKGGDNDITIDLTD